MSADLRHGRWQDVMADIEIDAMIADGPFGQRTHAGHDSANAPPDSGMFPNKIKFKHWTPDDVTEFAQHWSPRTRGWFVMHTSHDLIPVWELELRALGRYVFAPIPYLDEGKGPRVAGDGPASWSNPIIVARPRDGAWLRDWRRRRKALGLPRSLPGSYRRSRGDTVHSGPGGKHVGGKPLGVMRAIVRDYSFPGDIVGDPVAGHGTGLLAALIEGREAIGAEESEETFLGAQQRLGCGYARDLFSSMGV